MENEFGKCRLAQIFLAGSQVSSTNKMDEKSRFGELSTEEIQQIMGNAFPVTPRKVTKFGMRLFSGAYP